MLNILGLVLGFSPNQLAMRSELLAALPRGNLPTAASADVLRLVEDLERTSQAPSTSDFLLFGLQGEWDLRATISSGPEAAEPSAPTAAPSLLRAAGARVKDSTLWSTAEFEVEGMVGTLEVETSLEPTDRADTLALKAVDRSLRLPRAPAALTPLALMERLHASLSAEYRIDGEYRLQQVTTYMDDELRVCRCATARLGAAVSVYSRRGPPPQPAA